MQGNYGSVLSKEVNSHGNLYCINKTPKGVPLRRRKENGMVITLDKYKRPLGWCAPDRATGLIKKNRAVVYKAFPFTIILKDKDSREMDIHHQYRIKLDPGAGTTGVSVVEFAPDGTATVILFAQIEHKGSKVVENLKTRNSCRRNRRQRETKYRHCKYPKGSAPTARPEGWLPPSQHSIADNVISFVNKLVKLLGECDVTIETVKFDTQLMENPNIQGEEYQHGTLYGCEIKSYLIEKYQHQCQYCGGESGDHRLEWEHKVPKSRGGSDSIKNATLACHTCNQTKGNMTPEEWFASLKSQKKLTKLQESQVSGLKNVIAGKGTNQHLRYASWVNSTRWYLIYGIKNIKGVRDVELTTGGRTSYNRQVLGYEKDHHIDALVAGTHNPKGKYRYDNQPVLYIKAMGRGTRFRGVTNSCGIIIKKWHHRHKYVNGMMTGDIVKAENTSGKHIGTYVGRLKVRNSGCHDIKLFDGKNINTNSKTKFTIIQRNDGYTYCYSRQGTENSKEKSNSSRD